MVARNLIGRLDLSYPNNPRWKFTEQNMPMFRQAMSYVNEFPEMTKNLILVGNVGSGKTHLTNCIIHELDGRYPRLKIMFLPVPEFKNMVDKSFNDSNESTKLNSLIEKINVSDLLILDDLGKERFAESSNVYQNILFEITNNRYDKKPTIITTNLNSNELTEKYDQAIYSRLIPKDQDRIIKFENIKDLRTA